jgi:hypothetical protein
VSDPILAVGVRLAELEQENAQLRDRLRELLAIFGSDEFKRTVSIAVIHGYQVSPGVAKQNGEAIARAMEAVGEEVE